MKCVLLKLYCRMRQADMHISHVFLSDKHVTIELFIIYIYIFKIGYMPLKLQRQIWDILQGVSSLGVYFLKLVSAIFYQNSIFHQMEARQNLWQMFFISSKKLFLFSRYSNFCLFFPYFPHFPDSKGQMKVE